MDRIKTLEKRVEDTKTNIANYEKLRETLATFPHELYRPVRIPTPGGFEIEGVVENTNKIITLVGDGWLVEKSAFGAMKVVDDRLAILEKNQRVLEEALGNAKYEKEGLPVYEIREELDDKGNVVSSSVEEFDTGKAANLERVIQSFGGTNKDDKVDKADDKDKVDEEDDRDKMDEDEEEEDDDNMDTKEEDLSFDGGELPMMEIREELDDDGNIIDSTVEEAGNKDTDEIEKHLKLLNELAKKKLGGKDGSKAVPKTEDKPKETKPIYGPPPPPNYGRKVGGGIFKPQVTPGVLRQQSPKIEEINDDEEDDEKDSSTATEKTSQLEKNNPTITDVTEDESSDSLSSLQSSNSSISSNPAVAPESLLELELLADDAMDEEEDDLEADDDDWDFEDDDFDDMEADEDDHGRTRGSMFPGMSQDQLRSIMEGRRAAAAESKPPASSIVSDITESPQSIDSPTSSAPKSSLKSSSSKPKSVSFSNDLHIKRIPNKETIKNQERQELKKQQKQSRFKQELTQKAPEPEEDDDEEHISVPTVSDIAERAAPEDPVVAPTAPKKKMSRFMMARMGKEEPPAPPKQSQDTQSHDQTNPRDGRVLRGIPTVGASPTLDKDITDYRESMKLTPRPASQGHGHSHGHVRSRAISGNVAESPEPASPKVITKAPVSGLAEEKPKEAKPVSDEDKAHDDEIMKEVMSYLAENEDEEAFEQLHMDMDESKLAEELYRQRAQNHNAAVQRGLDSMADVDVDDGDDDMDLDDDMADAGDKVDAENDENAQVMNDIVENDLDDPSKDIIQGDLDMDPAVHRREVAEHYYRLRNNMVAKNGGFMKTDGEKAAEECDENAAPIKMSRFKAARMNRGQ
ncbi:hypothetical protein CJU89_5922 [Yarrowia sp. B02]|nr:hypothetical protein CJU89_5922 [Yarrowia sp. B02]